MPGMPRIKGMGKKVAYKILGVPANMKKDKKKQEKIDKRLVFEETVRVR
jgi:hypothetical protein